MALVEKHEGNEDGALAEYWLTQAVSQTTAALPDPTFSTDGVTIASRGDAIAVQSDGKIVAAGSTFNGATGEDMVLVRFNEDGSLDENFGNGGTQNTRFGPDDDHAIAILIRDGLIYLGGTSIDPFIGGPPDSHLAIARYHGDDNRPPGMLPF